MCAPSHTHHLHLSLVLATVHLSNSFPFIHCYQTSADESAWIIARAESVCDIPEGVYPYFCPRERLGELIITRPTHRPCLCLIRVQRKNGLFKKAYELGVLCSVDIAVIVFGVCSRLPYVVAVEVLMTPFVG
jgi:hypothetical protein